ncbi:primosomal protein DnaI [Staphylococcus sp. 17KM0847]|uniref:primosomal protein DnaI n=1 Tax=Staphylococcus sp. 17KM0847 TaxID=2583989 RepID=UPI0015DC1C99|nr:primosomal protein DnaI [Staphylococcus sp. 17KM0847]QLK85954.1 primosomal protein DnaI [Staphylococcus sp. 17KM0847]
MKPFSQIMGDNDAILKRIEKIKKQVLADDDVKAFLLEHQSEVTNAMIENDLNILQEFKDQQKDYTDHHTYETCPNFVKGHIPELYIENQRIKIRYKPCPCKIRHDEERLAHSMITSFHMHPDTLNAKLQDVYLDRRNRLDLAMQFQALIEDIAAHKSVKGFYLHGPFGTGKSFILGAIANELKEHRIPTTIIYVPEFIRTLKNGFKDGSTDKKIEQVRKAQVLILDDIGAEDMTPWVRDEVLGPVLHYRMIQELPTFFSSNMNFEELESHIARTKNGIEWTKAKRIMERIKALSQPYQLEGENYRNH